MTVPDPGDVTRLCPQCPGETGGSLSNVHQPKDCPRTGARYAKFHTRVHASNRHAGYGKPVTVIAQSQQQAVSRAIDLGWSGHRKDARVTFDRIEDIDPRECPHVTDADQRGDQ